MRNDNDNDYVYYLQLRDGSIIIDDEVINAWRAKRTGLFPVKPREEYGPNKRTTNDCGPVDTRGMEIDSQIQRECKGERKSKNLLIKPAKAHRKRVKNYENDEWVNETPKIDNDD